jgi:hypothetical protein
MKLQLSPDFRAILNLGMAHNPTDIRKEPGRGVGEIATLREAGITTARAPRWRLRL